MSDVSIHPVSTERFIDRLHVAFLEDDDASATKVNESKNVKLLQEQYRALANGDFQPAIDLMAKDIEMEMWGPAEIPVGGHCRGIAEVTAAMQRNFGALSEQQAYLLSVVAQGDVVVLLVEERGIVKATGSSYHIKWAQFFTFRDGKIVRLKSLAASVGE